MAHNKECKEFQEFSGIFAKTNWFRDLLAMDSKISVIRFL